ncbi:MAG: GFA family protein [Hyphomicrobiales bacterium]
MEWTGGCLCGAVLYHSENAPVWASYCHCGMCRKVSGAPYAGFVEFQPSTFEWTKGQPVIFNSTSGVIRRFCSECGTSLTFEADGVLFLSLGSLDAPEKVEFNCHTYTEFKLPCIKLTDGLPQFPGPAGGKGGLPIHGRTE